MTDGSPQIARRDLMRGASAAMVTLAYAGKAHAIAPSAPPFATRFAPALNAFRELGGPDIPGRLQWMKAHGFRAIEDNPCRRRPVAEQELIGQTLADLGMEMGVFVAGRWAGEHRGEGPDVPPLTGGGEDAMKAFVTGIRESLPVAARTGAKRMTVFPGVKSPQLSHDRQMANVIEGMKRAADVCAAADVTMVLEPLNTRVAYSLSFMTSPDEAYAICKAVGSPACKILFDFWHVQIEHGHLLATLDSVWDEVGYVQYGDNPGRKEPGTGEINYATITRHLWSKGYRGIIGMEHGQSIPGAEGERAVIAAYAALDDEARK
ncbi:Hydroxypyruvate isomerase [Tsuneonella dongtanensis]|uniref:Hydroxypyruvate isomerase n=1 Tax=Tsuneonella dongtanensis TaxID=692370 RepID=A0A1B2AB15_9SPHN|nr:TIM barrel protein [Tsuneonella dongtanensis]ANY19336.1 Hydroxypyruvate isomerase [Tsuneonella dongtanensis]